MRVVVTGGAGFVGSHLIEALVARGDTVVCVERPEASFRWVEQLPIEILAIGLDNVDALRNAMEGADVVYHLAALTEARTADAYYAVNTEGTARVFRAAAQVARPPRVVLMSSIAALGPCRNGVLLAPDTTPYPISHYGHSKLLAEAVAHAHRDTVPSVIIRAPSIFGPREKGVLTFFRMVSRGVAVTVGSWDREVSVMYVHDAVQGLIAAGTAPGAEGQTYVLSYPEPTTWRDFADAVAVAVGRRPTLLSIPASIASLVAISAEVGARIRRRAAILNRERVRDLLERWVCDPGRAMREIGFAPAYPPMRAAAETAAWYRAAGWL